MTNVSEHRNFATLGQLHWVIYQTPFFVFIFSLNIFLAFTATLGNTLILIALHKVSSIHPPTKCFLRCLAMTDFCVGVIVQPLFAAFLMRIASGNWRIIYLTISIFALTFCGLSLTTAAAISVDRLLALLLALRYRNTVTLRRVRCLVVFLLLVSTGNGFIHSLFSQDFAKIEGFVVIIISLFLSVFSHVKIFLKLQQHQAQVGQHVGHEQENGGGIPLNIERYKKTVCTIAWVQLAMVFCYFPQFIYMLLEIETTWYRTGSIFHVFAAIVVYFNSTLNPILYYWKIREVRQAVKTKAEIYDDIPQISSILAQRRARFAGHCYRSKDQIISDVICMRFPRTSRGRRPFNYIDCIARDINQDINDLPNLMADRVSWQSIVNSLFLKLISPSFL